jgi:CIC family chloride channel protein
MKRGQNRFAGFLARWPTDEYLFLSIIAILIGILGGYGAVLFRHAIMFTQSLFYGSSLDFPQIAEQIPWFTKLICPALGGAIVGAIIYFWAREAKGTGIPEIMEAVAMEGGYIRGRVTFAKIAASALSIGCGGSAGREGPIAQIGSALGSSVGQLLGVSRDRMRTLVGCGAAAGTAAIFNAPIAGVVFSVELLLGEFGVTTFSPIVLSSVTATTISRYHFGDAPAFLVPIYEMISGWEFFLYLGLGIFLGMIALLFVTVFYATEDLFKKLPLPDFIKPVVSGLLLGVMILYLPQVFGTGYGTIDMALSGEMAAKWLLLLIFAKIAATSITIGGGMSGGIFGPSLFIGAMAGGFYGTMAHSLLPEITAASGAYALLGMGGMLAAATHAPITSILIIFELTSEYTIILPLMITCIISTLLASYVRKGSIFTIKLMRRGIVLHRGREQGIMQKMMVSDVMRREVQRIPEKAFLTDVIQTFQDNNASYLQVVDDDDQLSGIISFRDIRQVLQEPQLGHLIVAKDLASSPVITVTSNENIEEALRKMGLTGVSQLPVVDHRRPTQVIGVIHHRDITAGYNREALTVKAREEALSDLKE